MLVPRSVRSGRQWALWTREPSLRFSRDRSPIGRWRFSHRRILIQKPHQCRSNLRWNGGTRSHPNRGLDRDLYPRRRWSSARTNSPSNSQCGRAKMAPSQRGSDRHWWGFWMGIRRWENLRPRTELLSPTQQQETSRPHTKTYMATTTPLPPSVTGWPLTLIRPSGTAEQCPRPPALHARRPGWERESYFQIPPAR